MVKSVELYYYLFISIMLGYPVHVCFTKNNLLLYFSYGIQLCTCMYRMCTNVWHICMCSFNILIVTHTYATHSDTHNTPPPFHSPHPLYICNTSCRLQSNDPYPLKHLHSPVPSLHIPLPLHTKFSVVPRVSTNTGFISCGLE